MGRRGRHPIVTETQKRERKRQYNLAHKEEKREYDKKYRLAHREHYAEMKREWLLAHPKFAKEQSRKRRLLHPEECRKASRKCYHAHLQQRRDSALNYRLTHKEKMRERHRKCYLSHKQKINENARKYAATHPEKRRKYKLRYRLAHPEWCKESDRKRRAEHPDKVKNQWLTWAHNGLGLAGYNALLLSQKGRCAICQQPFVKAGHVDHNHKSNQIRGLLCRPCNMALGHFKDSQALILKAIDYLNAEELNRDKQQTNAWNLKNVEKSKDGRQRWKQSDFTLNDYNALLRSQSSQCAICGAPLSGTQGHVDHNHKSGFIRGILCFPCNSGLGNFKESIDVLLGAYDYLQRYDVVVSVALSQDGVIA